MTLSRRHLLTAAGALPLFSARSLAAPDPAIRLNLNENPYGPSPAVLKAISADLPNSARYVGSEATDLEQQIAAFENVDPAQIILGEILDPLGLHLALSGPTGGEFIYSEPGYTALVDAVAPGGGVTIGVPLNAAQENDLDAIAARITPQTRAVYLVNPHNPSGTVSAANVFKDFLRAASQKTLVIVDEAYLEYCADFAERTAVPLIRAGANIIVFRTFGKIYGLAGLAIGYAIAPKTLALQLKARGLGEPHELNRLALAAASAALRDQAYIAQIREITAHERALWHAFLDQHHRPHSASVGNFVFFDAGRPHDDIARSLHDHRITIARAFPPLTNWVRISIGLKSENQKVRESLASLLAL